MTQTEANQYTWNKINNKWNQLSTDSKKLVEEKYQAYRIIFHSVFGLEK